MASTDIERNLDIINTRIKQLSGDIKSASLYVKDFENKLKIDPTNITLISDKFSKQREIVKLMEQRIDQYRIKLMQLDKEFANGTIKQSSYTTQVTRTKTEIEKLTIQLNNAKAACDAQAEATAKSQASFKKFTSDAEKVKSTTDSLAKKFKYLAVALSAVVYKAVDVATELYDVAKKYGTTVEEIQKNRNIFAQLTDDESAYENALTSLSAIIRSLNRGSGSTNAYGAALRKLGISLNTIKKSTAGEAYEMIFSALQKVTDETEQANLSMILFGDNGLNIANVAKATSEQINTLNSALENAGMISTEDATQMKVLSYQFSLAKQSISVATSELVVAFAPALIAIAGVIKNLANFLKTPFAKAVVVGTIAITTMAFVINKTATLMKSLTLITQVMSAWHIKQAAATNVATVAQGTLNASMLRGVILMSALTLGATALVGILTAVATKAQSASEETDNLFGTDTSSLSDDSIENLQSNVTRSVNNVVTNEKTLDINLNVTSTGDTAISKENAELISVSLMDKINKNLGGII